MTGCRNEKRVLILGIGNILMGDEGVGVHLVQALEDVELPSGIQILDGGTGSFQLLDPVSQCEQLILVDATIDGQAPGTISQLRPRFSSEYPPALTAHDIGLKDLLDALYLTQDPPEVTLFAISIAPLQELGMELSPEIRGVLPGLKTMILKEAGIEISGSTVA